MATAAETLKTTSDQFTNAGAQAFRDSVEKTLAGINDINAYSKANLEAVIASVTAAKGKNHPIGSAMNPASAGPAADQQNMLTVPISDSNAKRSYEAPPKNVHSLTRLV